MEGMTRSPIAELATDLVVARANGDFRVHLAAGGRDRSLCGQELRPRPPHKSFRQAGCPDCLSAARDAGQVAAREGERSWINLLRM